MIASIVAAAVLFVGSATGLALAVGSPGPQPTALTLSGVVHGTFVGPTSFGTWPVGHADCTSYSSGALCVTPARVTRFVVRPPGGVEPPDGNMYGAHPPFEVRFAVSDTGRSPFDLAVNGADTQLGFEFLNGGSYWIAVGADPSGSAPGCHGAPSGFVEVPAHQVRQLCFVFPASPLVPSGTYGPGSFQFLTFAGVAQWASGLDPAPDAPPSAYPLALVYAQPQTLPVPGDEQGWSCSGVRFLSWGCYWPGPGLRFHADLEDVSGRSLDYQHIAPLRAPRKLACLRSQPAKCDTALPIRSSGPMLLVLRIANGVPYHWRVGIEDASLDVQVACTRTGCATERLVGTLVGAAPGVGRCATAPLALLSAARRGHEPRLAFCVRFDTPRGAVAFGLHHVKRVTLRASWLPGPKRHWRGQVYEPFDGLVPYAAGFTPPGPF